jgi:hypothetical protein
LSAWVATIPLNVATRFSTVILIASVFSVGSLAMRVAMLEFNASSDCAVEVVVVVAVDCAAAELTMGAASRAVATTKMLSFM